MPRHRRDSQSRRLGKQSHSLINELDTHIERAENALESILRLKAEDVIRLFMRHNPLMRTSGLTNLCPLCSKA
jgi:hypothetical protein